MLSVAFALTIERKSAISLWISPPFHKICLIAGVTCASCCKIQTFYIWWNLKIPRSNLDSFHGMSREYLNSKSEKKTIFSCCWVALSYCSSSWYCTPNSTYFSSLLKWRLYFKSLLHILPGNTDTELQTEFTNFHFHGLDSVHALRTSFICFQLIFFNVQLLFSFEILCCKLFTALWPSFPSSIIKTFTVSLFK